MVYHVFVMLVNSFPTAKALNPQSFIIAQFTTKKMGGGEDPRLWVNEERKKARWE